MRFTIFLAGSVLAFFSPVVANAHTRWFAHEELAPMVTTEPTAFYFAMWALICAGVITIGILLEKRSILRLDTLKPRGAHALDRAASTFTMLTGAFLMIAGTHEYLFSPNLSTESGVPMVLIISQFAIGLAFVLGIYARLAAIVLVALWALALLIIGWMPLVENIWVLSTAFFIFIMGNDYFSLVSFRAVAHIAKQYRQYALPILRIGAGTTLLVLGFSEKMMHPEFGMHFLNLYKWNFMPNLGMHSYSDYLFTISAGAVESLLGLIFILGIMTRINALVVGIFFTIPLFFLGPIELAGHLPHFAAVVLLFLFGAGERWRFVRSLS